MTHTGGNELSREELYEKVWSEPTVRVAAALGISDVALAKRCKQLNVPKPSLGYWAKVAAGQKPEKAQLPPTATEVFIQVAEKPVAKTLSLPETTERLHPMATELLELLKTSKPHYDGRFSAGDTFSPLAEVGKDSIELTAKCFHVIVTNVESVGIPFRNSKGGQRACFRKGNDRLYLEIEDELVVIPKKVSRRGWQANDEVLVPSGKLTFSLSDVSYSSRKIKQWKDDGKVSLESLLSEIVTEIRGYFVKAVRQRAQAEIERKKQQIEWERHRRELAAKEVIRLEEERKQKHSASLEATTRARAEDLMKAAEWWRLYQTAMEFIEECEKRWRNNPSAELTTAQREWLLWARETAKAQSPFESGYPDELKDGAFKVESVPVGGPYPAKRDFPRPPTMPKIPAPVQPTSPSTGFAPELKQQYPFWLKYQGR